MRARWIGALVTVVVLLGAGAGLAALRRTGAPTGLEVVVAAVGDMACSASSAPDGQSIDGPALCVHGAVSDAVIAARPSVLLALGDMQYEDGAPGAWDPYDRTYGRLRAITRPVPGNHEYLTPGATGYFSYFGDLAGPAERGYYGFAIGSWYGVALNSECSDVGGCGDSSPQVAWLRRELAEHPARCTLAYWHIPRFSSGHHGDHDSYATFWRVLTEYGVDVVLNGHDHNYERFAPLTADGVRDDNNGIRSFVVGTGGRNLRPAHAPREGSERLIDDTFGFLALKLRGDGYTWSFVSIDGAMLDGGEDRCH